MVPEQDERLINSFKFPRVHEIWKLHYYQEECRPSPEDSQQGKQKPIPASFP